MQKIHMLAAAIVVIMSGFGAYGDPILRPFPPPYHPDFPPFPGPRPLPPEERADVIMVQCTAQNDEGVPFRSVGYGRNGAVTAINTALAECGKTSDHCTLVGCAKLPIAWE